MFPAPAALAAISFDGAYSLTFMIIIPMMILTFIISSAVKTVFAKYNTIKPASGLTGSQAARKILDEAGLFHVDVKQCKGTLTDHFNPKTNTVYLSEAVFGVCSASALGVAAHECGHAIQHDTDYFFVKVRTALVPVCNFTAKYTTIIVLVGLLLTMFETFYGVGTFLLFVGIVFYGVYTLFTLVTLPVEFNASKRARTLLTRSDILSNTEWASVRKVLTVAALTYVMSFSMSLLYLLRLLAILGSRKR